MKKEFLKKIIATPGEKHQVSDFSANRTGKMSRDEANILLRENVEKLAELQDKLYAQDQYAILAVFQGMDGAGKDGTIKNVMSGINPHGCQVFSFKQPSSEDLDHDYLWRISKCLPERGRIGIFNRSHYEDVLVTKVHPEILLKNKLPDIRTEKDITEKFWKKRYKQINNFEEYLVENGIIVIKFFLNVSQAEQKKRFISRLKEDAKNWKFSSSDFEESLHWDKYMKVYSDVLSYTSTPHAPWHVIPADNKWFMRYLVGQIICDKVAALKPDYPTVTPQLNEELEKYKELLLKESKTKKQEQD
ncbi:MAG: polyphosphate kinase 2 family protein [Tannerellaceae bacterium]|nr:polyphosphate kinase 2 family protein [Tannerellaceae bacterium]